MTPTGKSFFASLLLHGAIVFAAAALVVRPPGASSTNDRSDDLWGEWLIASVPSENAETASADDPALATPPEPVSEHHSPDMPSPSIALTDVPAPMFANAATNALQPSPPVITPPPTIAKRASRKTSMAAAPARSGGASGLSVGTANGGALGGGSFVPARYARCPAPIFPDEARKAKISGTVLLLVEVDENGRPMKIAVRRSSGHDVLDAAALRAVRNWRFEPARLDGKPVDARLEVPVRFALS